MGKVVELPQTKLKLHPHIEMTPSSRGKSPTLLKCFWVCQLPPYTQQVEELVYVEFMLKKGMMKADYQLS
jgi:hypothetical protein